MIFRIVAVSILWSFVSGPFLAYGQDKVRDLVVKVHAIRRSPDVLRPWSKLSPQNIYGSGVVIEGRRILTAAHVIQHASQIYVQPNQSAEKLAARVLAVAPGVDLALLQIEDEKFFDGRGHLPLAEELPRVKDTVNVYGYPAGGAELSVTSGIVSRIEFTDFYYSAKGLRIQVDAALNPGNSGGPAVSDGELIGLVFSLIPSAQNIGYLISVEEIRLFLGDVADGTYEGKPQMHDSVQAVENGALRKRLGLPGGVGGLMVTEPYRQGDAYPLKRWDVITHIGDQAIEQDGKVAVRYDLRLSALYLLQRHAHKGKVKLTAYRDGRRVHINPPVEWQREFVVHYLMNQSPRYFIYGPLVFSQASQEYIERLGGQRELALIREASSLIVRRYDKPAFAGEELVVVAAPMFPHRITKGYDDPTASVVSEVNGVSVKNLSHLVEILRDASEPQLVFRFAKRADRSQEIMVFNRAEIAAATEEVLNDNGIRYQYSADLRPVWERPRPVMPGLVREPR